MLSWTKVRYISGHSSKRTTISNDGPVALFGEQIAALLSALPDPAFILTRSGRYAAIFGGTDTRYYHDGSA
jgi:hypothetical protein